MSILKRNKSLKRQKRNVLKHRSEISDPVKDWENLFHKPTKSCITNKKLAFFNTYKNIPRISEKQKLKYGKSSARIEFLSSILQDSLKPMPLGLLKKNDIDLKRYSLGDRYAGALSSGLSHHKSVEKINLQANRLSESGSSIILQVSLIHI